MEHQREAILVGVAVGLPKRHRAALVRPNIGTIEQLEIDRLTLREGGPTRERESQGRDDNSWLHCFNSVAAFQANVTLNYHRPV